MKNIPALLFLIGFFSLVAFAQANEVSPCPKIEVIGPASAVTTGEKITFTVNVSGVDTNKLEYHWSISDGTIESGQGTPVIYVATDGLSGRTIIAEVEIKGLPEKCFNRGNETAEIGPGCGLLPKIDEYGKLAWDKEKLRLNSAVEATKNSRGSGLVIIISFPKDFSEADKKSRISKIEKYLISVHKLLKENVQIMESSENEFKIKIYLIYPTSPTIK